MSVASAGCVVWLERFQPAFALVAVGTLAYQSWLVMQRPRQRRTKAMLVILWISVATTTAVGAILIALLFRYS